VSNLYSFARVTKFRVSLRNISGGRHVPYDFEREQQWLGLV
jgi:hypothetical protein